MRRRKNDRIMSISCQFHSLGIYTPDSIIFNADLARIVDTTDQWIVERTGIRERRQLADQENASDLGLRASLKALAGCGLGAKDLTHIVTATCTPDYLSPSVACVIAGQLDAGPVMAFDLGAACTGFIYGLSICRSLLASDPASRILFVCVEALTRRVNWKDRGTCVLFGDAAAACVLASSRDGAFVEVVDIICESDGAQKDLIIVGGGTACRYEQDGPVGADFFISMKGRDTYKHAVRQMVNVCEKILQRNSLSVRDVDLVVPHQANMRIIEAVGSRLKMEPEKVFTNVANYGNTSSASIPLAIAEALEQGRIKSGDLILATAFGAGLTWGAALLKFH